MDAREKTNITCIVLAAYWGPGDIPEGERRVYF